MVVVAVRLAPIAERMPTTADPEPLWRRALVGRAKALQDSHNRTALSRLALARLLTQAGFPVSIVVLRTWSRAMQGVAYCWAVAFVAGREDVPPPPFVHEAAR
jgi:hypothetical protein